MKTITNNEKDIELAIDTELENIRNSGISEDMTAYWIKLSLENNLVDAKEIIS